MKCIKKLGYIKNNNGTFDVCVVDHLGSLWLATYDSVTDEYDTLTTVKDLSDAKRQADKMFQTQDEYVVTATKKIEALEDTQMENNEILLTPAALLDFLRQVDELADKDIILDENDSSITVTIGDSTYSIAKSDAEQIEVPDEVVDEVAEINENTYSEIDDIEYSELDGEETVEGGLIKEALKTLAIGGLVRLTGKLLGKDLLK